MNLYDNEIVINIEKYNLGKIDKKSADYYFDILNEKFPVLGTQINWNVVGVFYKKIESENIKLDFNDCISHIKNEFLLDEINEQIIYIGDSLTENAYIFCFKDINDFCDFVIEIPQHHYFIHPKGNWCISLNMTNDFNFGFAPWLTRAGSSCSQIRK